MRHRPKIPPLLPAIAIAIASACKPVTGTDAVSLGTHLPPPAAEVIAVLSPDGRGAPEDRNAAAAKAEVRVVDFGPQGEEQDIGQLRVRFSQPMQADRVPTFDVRPAAPGEVRWVDAFTAAYSFTDDPPGATRFDVRVRGTVVSKAGAEQPVDLGWTVATPRPTADLTLVDEYVVRHQPGEPMPITDWDARVLITLSDPAPRKAVRKALSVRATDAAGAEDAAERPMPFRLVQASKQRAADETEWYVKASGHWPSGTTIRVALDASLVTTRGPLGLAERAKLAFTTTPGVTAELKCADDFVGGCGPRGFWIRFDKDMPEATLRRVKVTPRPKNLSKYVTEDRPSRTVSFFGDFAVGQRYKVTLPKGLADDKGQPLRSARTLYAKISPPSPTLQLSSSGTLMGSHAGTFGIEARYLEHVDLAFDPLTDAELATALLRTTQTMFRKQTNAGSKRIMLKPHGPFRWDAQAVKLADLLGTPSGAVLVLATPGPVIAGSPHEIPPPARTGLFQQTRLGVLAGDSTAGSFVRVARLSDAEPVAGAQATVWRRTPTGMKALATYGPSDADGLIALPPGKTLPLDGALIVNTETDRFGLSLEQENRDRRSRGTWAERQSVKDHPVSAIITERPLYQPGDAVYVMGWLATGTLAGESRLRPAKAQRVELRLLDQREHEVARATVRNKPYGKYWAKLRIPQDVSLGRFTAAATIAGETFTTHFKVRQFKTPSFVVAAHLSATDVRHGDVVTATVQADYLHGMGVPLDRAVQRTRCSPSYYRPPGAKVAGVARPTDDEYGSIYLGPETVPLDDDAAGGRMRFGMESDRLPRGASIGCDVSVTAFDAAHEAMGAVARFTVHASRYLLLAQLPEGVREGERHTLGVTAVDFAGESLAGGDAKIELLQQTGDGEKRFKTCRGRIAKDGGLTCHVVFPRRGRVTVRLSGSVDGRAVSAQKFLMVGRKRRAKPVAPPDHALSIRATPTKVAPGDPLEVELESPHANATGLLVRSQGGIRATIPVRFVDHRARVSLLTQPTWVPQQYLDLLTTTPRTTDKLPAVDGDDTQVEVLDRDRRLTVTLEAPDAVGPGDEVSVSVSVHDHRGAGVKSHVSVWAVDEAILALAPWNFPDLVRTFAIDFGRRAQFIDAYGSLRWEYTPRLDPLLSSIGGGFGSGYGRGAGAGGSGSRHRSTSSRPQLRARFETVPIFVGDVMTNADGVATVHGKMPENLTTFRLGAVASAQIAGDTAVGRFGIGEGRTQVTSPFSVRPIVPSILRPGDRSEVSAMINNMTDKRGKLEVRFELIDAAGVLTAASRKTAKRTMTGSQLLVPLSIEAAGIGEARVRAVATLTPDDGSPTLSDGMEIPLAVVAERTLVEHAALYGSMPDDAAIAVAIDRPKDAAPGSAKLELSTHSSLLGGYQDNVQALVEYPYGCVEQTSTRLVPLLALGDLASRYPLGVENVDEFVFAAIARLSAMQTSEGGFAYWPGGRTPHFYASAYATWVLTMASDAGHPVPRSVLEQARAYLARSLAAWSTEDSTTTREDTRIAMAMHAIAASGELDRAHLERMTARFGRLPTFAKALVILAAHADAPRSAVVGELMADFAKQIDVAEAYARTRPPFVSYPAFFDTPVRTDAMALLVYTTVDPTNPVTEKLARGISRARDLGQLRNTQESAYALVAMAAYSRVAEKNEPNMLARAWFDDAFVLDETYRGRTFDFGEAVASLRRGGADPKVTLSKSGPGRLYYRVGMQWSPATMPTSPKSSGIVVEKRMYGADGELIGTRSVAAGSQVTIDIAVTVDIRRDYIVVEVPIPAGLTAIDTSLGSGHAATRAIGWSARWVDHKELRHDRIVLFSDSLSAGKHRQQISLRATTPGRYAIPPARAEGMYTPEVYGYTAGSTLTVVR